MKNLRDLISRPLFTILLLLTLATSAFSGNTSEKSIFDLMTYREVLDLTLEADFTTLRKNKLKDYTYPARLSFEDEEGNRQNWSLKISVRGAFRRVHCADMPPLRLNFKKSELKAAGLAKFDDLKLVTQCLSDEERSADMVLREYLAYKMFNEISPYSYRVQLVRITYKDLQTGERRRQWAFLIEDTAQLRHRVEAKKPDTDAIYNLPVDAFHHEHEKIVAMFQYFIGNTDWSLTTLRNLKLMEKHGKYIIVPYDFDFSGLVAAPYAAVSSEYGALSTRDRIYLGFPEDLEDLHVAQAILLGHRPKFEKMIRKFKYLSPASRRDMLDFLDSYYDNPEEVRLAERVVVTVD
ncbi:MAG: hypothetical protein D6816_09820 [Bacteroidetes bacterium]|nr:MAG: hypothetical protein D6816_09820 [Bacteroidota bacterium]